MGTVIVRAEDAVQEQVRLTIFFVLMLCVVVATSYLAGGGWWYMWAVGCMLFAGASYGHSMWRLSRCKEERCEFAFGSPSNMMSLYLFLVLLASMIMYAISYYLKLRSNSNWLAFMN